MNMIRSDFGGLQLDAKLIDSAKVIEGYIYLSEELVDQKLLENRRQRRLNYLFILLVVSSSFFVWHSQLLHPLLPVKYQHLEQYHTAPALGEMLSDTLIEETNIDHGIQPYAASLEFSQIIPEEVAQFIGADLSVTEGVRPTSKIRLEEVKPDVSGVININKILLSGHQLFKRDRLMSPPRHNAFVRYETVLSIDPSNTEALQGIQNIVDRYIYFAEAVIAKNESYKVPSLIKSAYQAGEKYTDVSAIIQRFSTYLTDDSLFVATDDDAVEDQQVGEKATENQINIDQRKQQDTIFVADQRVAQAALELYKGNQLPAAKKVLQNFTRLSGFWGESNTLLLKMYLADGDYAKAENFIYESKALDTHQFTEKAARIIMSRGDDQGALNMLAAHRPEFLENKSYYTLLASLNYKAGRFKRSAYWYRQLLSIDHQNPRLWLGLAVSLDSLNQNDNALQAFKYVRLYAENQSSIKYYINDRQLALANY
ncbi:MAG: hypothetical protein ACI8VC_000867 [Candidatus Endobugula sp.]|jgi:hypothetical protein